jgi:hypothetical protein
MEPVGLPNPRPSVRSVSTPRAEGAPPGEFDARLADNPPANAALPPELGAVAAKYTRADLLDPARSGEVVAAFAEEVVRGAGVPDGALGPEEQQAIAAWISQDPILRERLESCLGEAL